MALPTTGPTTGLAALIGATVGSSSFWFLAMTLCFIGVTFYAMPPPAIAIEESRKKKKKIVKTIATTTTTAAAATAAPATRAKKTSSADMVIESPKPAVTKQAAPLPDSPKSALELLASAPPATDNTASNKRDNKDTEYAFPLSKDASAFSPDPHHALVEAGETQQGFIVCMKGSFGFIRLLSGQSPDDLFFHISALEQVRGSEERSAEKEALGGRVVALRVVRVASRRRRQRRRTFVACGVVWRGVFFSTLVFPLLYDVAMLTGSVVCVTNWYSFCAMLRC